MSSRTSLLKTVKSNNNTEDLELEILKVSNIRKPLLLKISLELSL